MSSFENYSSSPDKVEEQHEKLDTWSPEQGVRLMEAAKRLAKKFRPFISLFAALSLMGKPDSADSAPNNPEPVQMGQVTIPSLTKDAKTTHPSVDKFPYELQSSGQLVHRSPLEQDGIAAHRVEEISGTSKERTISDTLRTGWKFEGNIWHTNADGQTGLKINPYTLLMPVQFEYLADEEFVKDEGITMPMHYSRWFDQAKTLKAAEDQARMKAYIKSEILKILADHIAGLGIDHQNHDRVLASLDQEIDSSSLITDIRLSGFAGPTGRASDGPETAMPGHIDQQNIVLGHQRAMEGASLVAEVLDSQDVIELCEKRGIDRLELKQVWEKALAGAKGYEDQFSPAEIKVLLSIAEAHGYQGTEAEKVFSVDYNYDRSGQAFGKDGRDTISGFTAAEEKVLNGIIATKRRAQVDIQYQGHQDKKYIIPLPFLLLLPLLKLRRKSKPKGIRFEYQRIIEEGQASRNPIPRELPEPSGIESFPPTNEILQDDLYSYYGHPTNEEGGLDYEALVLDAEKYLQDATSIEDTEEYVSANLIKNWQKLDTANREAALRRVDGSLPEGWDDGLDYELSEKQFFYARLHSRMLLLMIATKQRDEAWTKDYGYQGDQRQLDRDGSPYRDYLNEFTTVLDLQDYDQNGDRLSESEVLADREKTLISKAREGDVAAYRELLILRGWYVEGNDATKPDFEVDQTQK